MYYPRSSYYFTITIKLHKTKKKVRSVYLNGKKLPKNITEKKELPKNIDCQERYDKFEL